MEAKGEREAAIHQIKKVVLLLAALYAVAVCVNRFANSFGMDFYHYWGVPRAVERAEGSLGSPYPEAAAYARSLAEIAGESDDRRLQRAERVRAELDLTGTPLCYAASAVLPQRYSSAYGGFVALLAVSLCGAVLGLARLIGRSWADGGLMALALLICSDPVAVDQRVGNVNALQLAALVGLAALAGRPGARAAALTAGGLCAMVLVKPSVLGPCLALLLCAALRWDRRSLAVAAASGGLVGAALVVWPCVYFGSSGVWGDWYAAVNGAGPTRLAYPSEYGNYAAVRLMTEAWGLPTGVLSAGMFLGFCVTGAAALARAARALGGGWAGLVAAARATLGDPLLAVGLAVVVTLGASPLAWTHYFTLALLPALWLCWTPGRSALAAPAGALFLILTSGPLLEWAAQREGAAWAAPAFYVLSWGVLWAALLERVGESQGART